MPATYEPISTTTLGANSTTITFSSIPGTYTDLVLVVVGTGTASNGKLRMNADSATNYSQTVLYGSGTSAISSRLSSQTSIDYWGADAGISSTIPSMSKVTFFNYAGSTNKTVLIENPNDQNGSGAIWTAVGLYRSTSAITQINLIMGSTASYKTGTTATLYGILKA